MSLVGKEVPLTNLLGEADGERVGPGDGELLGELLGFFEGILLGEAE